MSHSAQNIEPPAVAVSNNAAQMAVFFARPNGLVRLLDAECAVPRATDATLMSKLTHHHHSPGSPFVHQKALQFSISHFHGRVEYDAQGFLASNRDRVPEMVTILLQGCRLDVVREMYSGRRTVAGLMEEHDLGARNDAETRPRAATVVEAKGKKAKPAKKGKKLEESLTVANMGRLSGQRFLMSWRDLLDRLKTCDMHFVVCIRPCNEVC